MSMKKIISSMGAVGVIGGLTYAATGHPIEGGFIFGISILLAAVSMMWKTSSRMMDYVGSLTGEVTPDNIQEFTDTKPKRWGKNGRIE